jgi:hypothetical protein
MIDLDILVPYEQRFAALELLETTGFARVKDSTALVDVNELATKGHIHHYLLRGGPEQILALEVHFRLLGSDERLLSSQHLAWFWQQMTTYESQHHTFPCLTTEAHFLYLCAHAVLQHGIHEFVIRRYLDLHFIIENTAIDWSIVVEQAVRLRWTYAVERALRLTQELFSTELPDNLYNALHNQRPPDEDIGRVDAMAGTGARLTHVMGMTHHRTWLERIQYLGRIVIPTADYMRQRYQIAASQAIWPFYLVRWYEQLQQVAEALGNRFRSNSEEKS